MHLQQELSEQQSLLSEKEQTLRMITQSFKSSIPGLSVGPDGAESQQALPESSAGQSLVQSRISQYRTPEHRVLSQEFTFRIGDSVYSCNF